MSRQSGYRQITVRFQPELFDALAEAAHQEQRSIAGLLRVITTRYLDDRPSARDRDRRVEAPA